MHAEFTPAYQHTQKGPWALLLVVVGFGAACFGGAWLAREEPTVPIALIVAGILMLLVGACFRQLTITDKGDRLAIQFGPLTLFRRTVRYSDIQSAEIGRTLLLDGWGIHYSIRGGWVWNLWGRSCVVLRLHDRVLRIGTDDAENLAHFVQTRIVSPVPQPSYSG